jgi:ribonuclease P/MRP protein subunit POP1
VDQIVTGFGVQFWSSLKDLQTSGSVPRGMVIGFKVYDPRLK